VILKWALKGSAQITYSGVPSYRSTTVLTATTNTPSKVTFFENNKRITGCISIATSSNSATCNWKPASHGSITLSIQVTPTDSNYSANRISLAAIYSSKRAGNR
jgi:hypothetical protein